MVAVMTPLRVTEPVRITMRVILPFGEDAMPLVSHGQMRSLHFRIPITTRHPRELSIDMHFVDSRSPQCP